jgi:outer membrane PBP1 activator LpoA protein
MKYRERVLPSLWNLALPLILFPSVIAVMLPLNGQLALPIATLVTLGFLALQFFSSPVLKVTDGQFHAKEASIDLQNLGSIEVIPKNEVFLELGRNLDARAWLAIQASVKGLVKVEIKDANDPTPYWLVSTRNPQELVAALRGN